MSKQGADVKRGQTVGAIRLRMLILLLTGLLLWGLGCDEADRPDLRISTTRLTLGVGETGTIQVNGGRSPYELRGEIDTAIAEASLAGHTVTVTGLAPGSTAFTLHDSDAYSEEIAVVITGEAPLSELEQIQDAIADRSARWSASETPVTDLPPADRRFLLGALTDQLGTGPSPRPNPPPGLPDPADLPASFDWRSRNGDDFVTPVPDQRLCAASWAFATIAALESRALMAGLPPVTAGDLSEQILIDCGGAGGCGGGYIDAASDFLTTSGTASETCHPYEARNGSCDDACTEWEADAVRAANWHFVSAGQTATVERLKQELFTYGPLVTIFQVFTDFYYYDRGVYTHVWGGCDNSTGGCGHGVLIVGWDDAEQAFIVKNSWDDDWGEAGFFRIAYSEVTGETRFGRWTIAYGEAIRGNAVAFVDPDLEAAVRSAVNKPEGHLFPEDLTGLTLLSAPESDIDDLTGIRHLVDLTDLRLPGNQVSDLGPLANMAYLSDLDLSGNVVTDIQPLVDSTAIDAGDRLDLRGNPLGETACTDHIPRLEADGVTVHHNCGDVISGTAIMSDGARIYYEITGEGDPLLLIHGQETDAQGDFKALHSWDPQFAALADSYQTIRFDIRGFGRSPLVGGDPLETFSWDVGAHRTTADVVELMDDLGISSAHIAGVSLGSAIAAQLGVFYPEKADKLVLVSPWDHTFPDSDSRLADLEAISHKTALIGGEDDPGFEALVPNLRERAYTPLEEDTIPGAGAYPNTEQPDAFNTAVRAFLAEPIPETYALNVQLSPASPAVLGLGIKVFATFDYVIGHPEGAYMWAKPAATNGGQHHEPSLILTGTGSVSRYFYLDIPETVTQVNILMEAPNSEVLYEEILPVSYTWTATP